MRQRQRVRKWRDRLGRYLARAAHERFTWGATDCALFAAGAVQAMTGLDPAADWRGHYSTERGAWRVLRQRGFESLADAVAAVLPEIPPRQAVDGDVAAIGEGRDATIGIVSRDHVICRAAHGIALVPRERIKRVFRCG